MLEQVCCLSISNWCDCQRLQDIWLFHAEACIDEQRALVLAGNYAKTKA